MSVVHASVRRRQPAERLALGQPLGAERERRRRIVAFLRARRPRSPRCRDRTRGGVPVLKRPRRSPDRPSAADRPDRGALRRRVRPGSAARPCASGRAETSRSSRRRLPRSMRSPAAVVAPRTRPPSSTKLFGHPFEQRQVRRRGERVSAARRAVEPPVALGAGSPHRRTARAVEHPKLDARRVGELAHQAPERVDLPHELPLGEPADRGIAGHPADRGKSTRSGGPSPAHARRRVRGLEARVSPADNEDVVLHAADCLAKGPSGLARAPFLPVRRSPRGLGHQRRLRIRQLLSDAPLTRGQMAVFLAKALGLHWPAP